MQLFLLSGTLAHPLNFTAGWGLIVLSFLVGAIIGLGFHREDFLGGYVSFRRRLLRLGHIALVALGMLNILYSFSPIPAADAPFAAWPGRFLIAGAIAMPTVCFLSAWKRPARHLFFIPVTLLLTAAVLMFYFGVTQ